MLVSRSWRRLCVTSFLVWIGILFLYFTYFVISMKVQTVYPREETIVQGQQLTTQLPIPRKLGPLVVGTGRKPQSAIGDHKKSRIDETLSLWKAKVTKQDSEQIKEVNGAEGKGSADDVKGKESADGVKGKGSADSVKGKESADDVKEKETANSVEGKGSADNVKGKGSADGAERKGPSDDIKEKESPNGVKGKESSDGVEGKGKAVGVKRKESADGVKGKERADGLEGKGSGVKGKESADGKEGKGSGVKGKGSANGAESKGPTHAEKEKGGADDINGKKSVNNVKGKEIPDGVKEKGSSDGVKVEGSTDGVKGNGSTDGIKGKGSAEDATWWTPESVFAERRRRVLDICANYPDSEKGGIKGVFTTHQSTGVIYCFVPKAGCTFWKRVFYVVNQSAPLESMNVTVKKVDDITRHSIHEVAGNGMDYLEEEHDRSHFPTRFTVTRDPFSRLLSSYLDKVYLPDFWISEMVPMIRRRRRPSTNKDFLRSHFDNMAAMFDPTFKDSSTSKEKKCGKYVTFAEFVQGSYGRLEPHWMPLSQICNPCKFNVTHISYMETFTQDARAILNYMGRDDLLDHLNKDTQVNEELQMIVGYFFDIRQNYRHIDKCASAQEIAYRLWNNFRWRGYIDPEIDYFPPDAEDPQKVKENLERQVTAARVSGLKNKDKMKAAKKLFYRKMYLTLSKQMLIRVINKYNLDIKFYGYEKKRDELISLFNQ